MFWDVELPDFKIVFFSDNKPLFRPENLWNDLNKKVSGWEKIDELKSSTNLTYCFLKRTLKNAKVSRSWKEFLSFSQPVSWKQEDQWIANQLENSLVTFDWTRRLPVLVDSVRTRTNVHMCQNWVFATTEPISFAFGSWRREKILCLVERQYPFLGQDSAT